MMSSHVQAPHVKSLTVLLRRYFSPEPSQGMRDTKVRRFGQMPAIARILAFTILPDRAATVRERWLTPWQACAPSRSRLGLGFHGRPLLRRALRLRYHWDFCEGVCHDR